MVDDLSMHERFFIYYNRTTTCKHVTTNATTNNKVVRK